jgi:hypothetical protein
VVRWVFGGALVKRVGKPFVVFLNNAFIHTAKKLKSYGELPEERHAVLFSAALQP